jgi:hypothetical protein
VLQEKIRGRVIKHYYKKNLLCSSGIFKSRISEPARGR